jgi:hypothetical protein
VIYFRGSALELLYFWPSDLLHHQRAPGRPLCTQYRHGMHRDCFWKHTRVRRASMWIPQKLRFYVDYTSKKNRTLIRGLVINERRNWQFSTPTPSTHGVACGGCFSVGRSASHQIPYQTSRTPWALLHDPQCRWRPSSPSCTFFGQEKSVGAEGFR